MTRRVIASLCDRFAKPARMSARTRIGLIVCGFALAALIACGRSPPFAPEASSGLVRSYSWTIGGKSYSVHRIPGRRNLFRVTADGGGPGLRRQMAKAVRLTYGCHALELTETRSPWLEAEARGSVCTGGYQRYNSNR